MSVREEDRKKNSCPSRGLGIAAAAIGVGVGAALYYFFNKRQENPNSEGSSSDWNSERPHEAFPVSVSDDSYTTISENETSDTSINSSYTDASSQRHSEYSVVTSDESNSEEDTSDSNSVTDSASESDSDSNIVSNNVYLSDSAFETELSLRNGMSGSDSEMDWDITTSSLGIPDQGALSPMLMFFGTLGNLIGSNKKKRTEDEQMNRIRQQALAEEEQMNIIRQQAFRERSWTLEECSICFDVMLRNQEVTTLPCTHNFHTECILPWLQEKQTCPNCRKVAE